MLHGRTQIMHRFGSTCETILSLMSVLRVWTSSSTLYRYDDGQRTLYGVICCRQYFLCIWYWVIILSLEMCNEEWHAVMCIHSQLKKHLFLFCSTMCDSFWKSFKIGSQIRWSGSLFFSLQEKYVLVFTRFFWRPTFFKAHI